MTSCKNISIFSSECLDAKFCTGVQIISLAKTNSIFSKKIEKPNFYSDRNSREVFLSAATLKQKTKQKFIISYNDGTKNVINV